MANNDEIATFEGLISLNKNFGSGYFYELIMEDAIKIETKWANKVPYSLQRILYEMISWIQYFLRISYRFQNFEG